MSKPGEGSVCGELRLCRLLTEQTAANDGDGRDHVDVANLKAHDGRCRQSVEKKTKDSQPKRREGRGMGCPGNGQHISIPCLTPKYTARSHLHKYLSQRDPSTLPISEALHLAIAPAK